MHQKIRLIDEEIKQIQQNIIFAKYSAKIWQNQGDGCMVVHGINSSLFSGYFKLFIIKQLGCVYKECFGEERKQFLNITEFIFLRQVIFNATIFKGCSVLPATATTQNVFGLPISEVAYKTNPKSVYFIILQLQPQTKSVSSISHIILPIWLFLKSITPQKDKKFDTEDKITRSKNILTNGSSSIISLQP